MIDRPSKPTTIEERRRWMQQHGHPDPYADLDAVERIHVGHTEPTQYDRLHAVQWMDRNSIGNRPWDRKPEPMPANPCVRAWIGCYQDMESLAGRTWWILDDLKPTGSLDEVRAYVDRLIREHVQARKEDGRAAEVELMRSELRGDRT